jgi:multidrug efflux pump subunit AcrB
VRNNEGKMIPLRSLVEVRVVVGPPALIRYNNIRAVTVLGSPAPGISSGEALKAMEQVAAKTLPAGFAGEWTDTSFQEKRAEGKTGMILGFALLFAYLSWSGFMRVGPFQCPCCCQCRWVCSARSSPWCLAG